MKFLCLIYGSGCFERPADPNPSNSFEREEVFEFVKGLREAGQFLGGSPLDPCATASYLEVRDGQVTMTDGPFAETKELLAGFYAIEANSKRDAEAIMARAPQARVATIEIREILEIGPTSIFFG